MHEDSRASSQLKKMIITCFGREKFQPKEKGKSISGRKRYMAVDFIKWFLMGISNKGPRIIFRPDLFFSQTECNTVEARFCRKIGHRKIFY